MHAGKHTILSFLSSEELTPSVFLHDLEEIKTIGEFACDFEVAIFSGPIDVDFKNKLFHMYRGTNNKIQCELFIKATDDEPQLKKRRFDQDRSYPCRVT